MIRHVRDRPFFAMPQLVVSAYSGTIRVVVPKQPLGVERREGEGGEKGKKY